LAVAFLNNLTIGKKITLLTALGLLLGVGVFSALGMRAVNQATDSMLQDRLTTARLVADYVDEALGRALVELENTARNISEGRSPEALDNAAVTLGTAYSRSAIDVYGVYLIDDQGKPVWSSSSSPALNGGGLSEYPSVRLAVETGDSTISGMVSAPVTDVPVILLAASTPSGPDRLVLVSAVDVSRSGIGGFLRPLRLGDTGYAEIVDQNGIVVIRTDPGPKLSPFERSDHSARFAALIAAGEPARGVCHTCHESPESPQKIERQDVLAFVPLSTADWGVVIRQSEAEALAPAAGLRQSLVFSGAGLVTVALAFVIVTTRDVGSRIGTLTNASRRIADGDLKSPVAALGHDEVGTLAATLDDMRVKLRSSYGDLEQKTRELSSLLSVSEILTSTANLPVLLDSVLVKTVEVIPGADGGVLLVQPDAKDRASVYTSRKPGKTAEIPDVTGPVVRLSSESAEITDSARAGRKQAPPDFLQSTAWTTGVKSNILADVTSQRRRIGCIVMVNMSDHRAFSESDLRLLQGIADYIAIAIEKSQLAKQAEEARAIYEADRLRSELISSVSHELRSPLTLIKGYSTSLLRHDVKWDEAETREFLRVIDEKTDVLRDLIDKLLQSAKLEAGALKLEKEPLLIPQLVRKLVKEADLNARKHSFTLDFSPSFPVIEADVRCMEQVLKNLLQNAVKYSPERTEIVVAGEAQHDQIVVHVSDQGIGISLEDQERIFERFFRVDNPAVHSTAGSGLGLSIVKAHVEAHGGTLWLDSRPGNGSRFSFSLPMDTARSED
jgi:signal transduction histidine kinase/HAMP domain-containing protein